MARERHHERISRRSHLNAGNSHNESIFVLCPGHKTATASLTAPVSAHCLPLSPSQLQLCELSRCIQRATSNLMPFFFFFWLFFVNISTQLQSCSVIKCFTTDNYSLEPAFETSCFHRNCRSLIPVNS